MSRSPCSGGTLSRSDHSVQEDTCTSDPTTPLPPPPPPPPPPYERGAGGSYCLVLLIGRCLVYQNLGDGLKEWRPPAGVVLPV